MLTCIEEVKRIRKNKNRKKRRNKSKRKCQRQTLQMKSCRCLKQLSLITELIMICELSYIMVIINTTLTYKSLSNTCVQSVIVRAGSLLDCCEQHKTVEILPFHSQKLATTGAGS